MGNGTEGLTRLYSGRTNVTVVPAKAGTHTARFIDRNVVMGPRLRGDDTGIKRTVAVYYVYILADRRHGTLYIGVTNNVQNRLELHRIGLGSQ